MPQLPCRWMLAVLLTVTGVASATPALPSSAVAVSAVQSALSTVPAPTPAATQAGAADQDRAAAIAQTEAQADTLAQSVIRGRSAVVRATAYNSLPGQTDSSPFITATGTRVRFGVVALSRDLLRTFPYGSKVMVEDLSGRFSGMLKGQVFIVEDTMAARKSNSLDIWMPTRSQAINFGARSVRITAVR